MYAYVFIYNFAKLCHCTCMPCQQVFHSGSGGPVVVLFLLPRLIRQCSYTYPASRWNQISKEATARQPVLAGQEVRISAHSEA